MKVNTSSQLVIELKLQGKSLSEIQKLSGLSRPTVIKILKSYTAQEPKNTAQARKIGRPSIVSRIFEKKLIQGLMNSEKIFDLNSLFLFTKKTTGLEITPQSFKSTLQKVGWVDQNSSGYNNAKVVHYEDKQRQVYILMGLANGNHYWSFHDCSPKDHDYAMMAAHLESMTPQLKSIMVDIFDRKYSPKLNQLEKTGINIFSTPNTHNDSNLKTMKNNTSIQLNDSLKTYSNVHLTHLQKLEAESIHIMREVIAEAENPVMLYSIGKDSAVMLHLAIKAFYPAKIPFPLLHVDTKWKFKEMYAFREKMAQEHQFNLLVHTNPEGLNQGINPFIHGSKIHTDLMKTEALKQALNKYQFDVAFGGARRDEEKSRAKERIFSFRNQLHHWDPKNQRPELWNLYNTRKNQGESIRVFPLSNWTELDIWQYIYLENIPIVPLYFAKDRPVVNRNGTLIMVDDARMPMEPGEIPIIKKVRFRTLGCYPLTGAIESNADDLLGIIQEMLLTNTSERQGRVIDHDSSASMEKKKQEGYF